MFIGARRPLLKGIPVSLFIGLILIQAWTVCFVWGTLPLSSPLFIILHYKKPDHLRIMITYSREELLLIRDTLPAFPSIDSNVMSNVRRCGVNAIPSTRRGCRSGKNKHQSASIQWHSLCQCHDAGTSNVKFGMVNARSVRNKACSLVDYILDMKFDLFVVTETWLKDIDDAHRAEVTPPGYKLFDHPRPSRPGGGIASWLEMEFK